MELFIVRHAVAVAKSERRADATRGLTRAGRAELEKVVKGLGALDIGFDSLVHSPLRRAAETAELLVPLLDGSTRVDAALAAPPAALDLDALVGDRVALVGHQPYLGELCSLLLFGSTDAAERFPLQKSGVVWLRGTRVAAGAMDLVAMLPPDVLISSGRG